MTWQAYPLAIGAALSCLGYGLAAAWLLGLSLNFGDTGILGLVCLAMLGCAIHFVCALSLSVQWMVLGAGLLLCVVLHPKLLRLCRGNPVAALVGASAFFHRYALPSYDTGLYHLQSVMWNRELPITPGLGNLHGRLAFNSTLFVMAPLDDQSSIGWISALLLLLFVLAACYHRFSKAPDGSVRFWFYGLVAVLLGVVTPTGWVGVLNADGFVSILILYFVCLVLALDIEAGANVPMIVLTAALAITVKLNAAPLLPWAMAVVWFHRRKKRLPLWKPAAFAAVFLGLWLARGLALSGCAVYPVPQTCDFNLPWAVSYDQVASESKTTRAWARAPNRYDYTNVMADWRWLGPWAARSSQDWSSTLCFLGCIAGLLPLFVRRRVDPAVIAVFAALVVCLMYWFSTAPAVRFGAGYLAAAGLLGLSVFCEPFLSQADIARRLVLEGLGVAVLIGCLGLIEYGNGWTIPARVPVEMKTAPDGRTIWVTRGDHYGSDQCWDHALPCTPDYDAVKMKRVQWR